MAIYLAIKEIWRNKNRFLLFSMVIALITILVLFIAGLAEGLGTANREYLAKLDGELIVFQEDVKLSTVTSRLGSDTLRRVERLPEVANVGPVGLSNAELVLPDENETTGVSLIGVKPGKPGGAPSFEGTRLTNGRSDGVVIDGKLANENNLEIGDSIKIKTIQGTDEVFSDLKVIGITDGRQYFFQPSLFLSMETWDKVRPQSGTPDERISYNIFVVQLENPEDQEMMAALIQNQVEGIEVVDRVTAYEATPGYSAQQTTLNTQRGFTLLIGILVIGGFFQIQTLQKIPNIGMLKAIGTSNWTVGVSTISQIIAVTIIGVGIGSLLTFALSLGLPSQVPIVFTPQTFIAAISSLLIIGPVGGLVSVWMALKAEPLIALGLNS